MVTGDGSDNRMWDCFWRCIEKARINDYMMSATVYSSSLYEITTSSEIYLESQLISPL